MPARWVEDGAVAPGELAARAVAAGLRAVFEGLREVGREGVPAEGGRVEVRVNLVAVGEEEGGVGGEVKNGGVEKNGEAKKGVEADENGEEGYRECARAVVRVACDESVSGMFGRGDANKCSGSVLLTIAFLYRPGFENFCCRCARY